MLTVSIVILNWNGKDLLAQFLPKIIEHTPNATIYVADNASTDDSVLFVENTFSTVKCIKMQSNLGFAGGYNEALKQVDSDILVLVNSDIEVTPNWLQPIRDIFDNEPTTAIIQPKIKDFKNKDYFEYAGAAGGFIDQFAFPYCRGRIMDVVEKDKGQYDGVTPIFWASGACFAIRKSIFDQLNGFDADFFAHQEEIDLCWRAINLGYTIKYTPKSKVYHVGGATLSASNPKKVFLNFRNSLLTITKNVPLSRLFYILFTRMILDGVAGIRFFIKGEFSFTWAIVRAHVAFYAMFGTTFQKRGSFQKTDYYHTKSIVWSYFVRKKQTFTTL